MTLLEVTTVVVVPFLTTGGPSKQPKHDNRILVHLNSHPDVPKFQANQIQMKMKKNIFFLGGGQIDEIFSSLGV